MMNYIAEWLHFILIGVAIVVVAVPEGLPLAVMISLAYSVQKMLEDQNFVKRLSSCEIMGGANNICSDKTGTLTKNEMTWTNIWAGENKKIKNTDGPLTEVFSDRDEFMQCEKSRKLIAEAVSCNTLGNTEEAQATELAMLKFITKCGVDFLEVRKNHVPNKGLLRFPFDSSRKRMSTFCRNITDSEYSPYNTRMHVKGASEIILATCSHYLDKDGSVKVMDDLKISELRQLIESYASEALRTIGFAYRDVQEGESGGPDHDEQTQGSKIFRIEE